MVAMVMMAMVAMVTAMPVVPVVAVMTAMARDDNDPGVPVAIGQSRRGERGQNEKDQAACDDAEHGLTLLPRE